MQAMASFVFILVTYAIADFIATKTKSVVSSMFTCSVIFIVGFWLGVPKTLFSDSMLYGIGALLITSLLVHMGTLMSLKQLKAQWKTVLIASAAVVGIAVSILTIGRLFMDREVALVSAPVISGGVIAALKMQEALLNSGSVNAESLAVFATVLMVMEGFVGYPIASFMLKKEAKRVKVSIDDGTYIAPVEEAEDTKKRRFEIPEKYRSENYYLAKVALIALLATYLSSVLASLTGSNIIDKNILSLILGIVFSELGFLDHDILTKANANGFAMAALMAVVFASLANATPEVLFEIIPYILLAQFFGIMGYIVFGIVVGKLLKVSPWMAIAIGSTANYGFPGTYIISKEVANAVGETAEEKSAILSAIMPKMIVAGFITVSIASVFLASFIASLI